MQVAVPAVATRLDSHLESRAGHGPSPAASAPPPGADAAARLAALVRAGAPLRRALAAVAGKLVANRAWERLGFARLRDYAVERAGVSARQLQELAHVDAALAELLGIEAALAAGSLSWTKARLLCRVATREDEALWLAAAGGMSARALAREVRAVDGRALESGGSAAPDEDEMGEGQPRETVRLHCTAAVRAKWFHARQLAHRIAGETLPPWACAEAVAAETLSAIGLEVEPEFGPEPLPAEAEQDPAAARATGQRSQGGPRAGSPVGAGLGSARALDPDPPPWPPRPAFVEALLAGLASADAFELDARLRRALRLEQLQLAQIGPLLLAVASERLFWELGYRGLDEYAREQLGMAPSKARALLRLERLALVSGAFGEAWQEGRISWTQAEALAPLLVLEHSGPWHGAWIQRARRVTVRRLRDDVDHAIASDRLDPAALPALPAELQVLQTGARSTAPAGDIASDPSGAAALHGLQTGARSKAPGGSAQVFFAAPRDVARLFRAVLATVQRRIERARGRPSNEDEALDAMLEHAMESWGRDRPLPKKYRVFARDGWRCTVPGCTAYRNLHQHHVEFRAAGGSDDLANCTTLCAWHHLRGVHAGRVRCRGRAPGGLRFALGLRAGLPPLVTYASGDLAVAG